MLQLRLDIAMLQAQLGREAYYASGDDVLDCSIGQHIGGLQLPQQLLGPKLLSFEHPAKDTPGPGHRREMAPSLHAYMHARVSKSRQAEMSAQVQRAEADLLMA